MWKSQEIFILKIFQEEQTRVKNSIRRMSNNIQCQEVKTQSNNGFPSKINPNLWIEWNTPCNKVNPSNNNWCDNQSTRISNFKFEEQVEVTDEIFWGWCSSDFDTSSFFRINFYCEIWIWSILRDWNSFWWPVDEVFLVFEETYIEGARKWGSKNK